MPNPSGLTATFPKWEGMLAINLICGSDFPFRSGRGLGDRSRLLSLALPRFARLPTAGSGAAGLSDEALFERTCRSDDHAAFGELMTRYRARVAALTQRMLSPSQTGIDPEDVAQEAFVDAYRRRSTFRRGAAFRPWLYSIAVNRCLDQLRTRGREQMVEPLPSDEETLQNRADPSGDPADEVLQKFEMQELERVVATLPVKWRAVLILRYLDDLSYEEIGVACGLPVGTVKTHLFRARAELKRRLE